MVMEGTTHRIERRFNRRGEKKDRVKPVKKFDNKKFNKSTHITRHCNNFEDYVFDFDYGHYVENYYCSDDFEQNDYSYDNESLYDNNESLYDNNDSLYNKYFESLLYYRPFSTNELFRKYFKVGYRFYIHNEFISKIKSILNEWNNEFVDLFKNLASCIYHKYKTEYYNYISLANVFKNHLSMFLNEKSININYNEINCILDVLFIIAKTDEKYNYIFNNYRNITLFIINKIINYQFIKQNIQLQLFSKGFQQNIIPPIEYGLQEYIMSFVP
jgi:hypothetical protein